MIKSIKEKDPRVELNLMSSEGNAFFLIATARNIAVELGWSSNRIKAIMEEMTSGSYEYLLQVMEREFGNYVIMYKWKKSRLQFRSRKCHARVYTPKPKLQNIRVARTTEKATGGKVDSLLCCLLKPFVSLGFFYTQIISSIEDRSCYSRNEQNCSHAFRKAFVHTSVHHNVWCYTLVLMAYSTCYLLVRFISKELELERKRFFFSFLCGGENKK